MHLKRMNGTLVLCFDANVCITFRESWITALSKLQYDQFGEYIKTEIYPALADSDRKIWNKSTISNKELLDAATDFIKNPE